MNDRDLVELAAKAVGYEGLGEWDERLDCLWDGEGWTFDPLNDDGDAFRLAMKLGMHITVATAEIWRGGREMIHVFEDSGDDCAATRRAVVRAAAEIGMKMP